MPAGSAFAIVGHFFYSITDVVVQTMNTIFSARIMKRWRSPRLFAQPLSLLHMPMT